MSELYAINWQALRGLPPIERIEALNAILGSVQQVTRAERERTVASVVDGAAGNRSAAARELEMTHSRVSQIYRHHVPPVRLENAVRSGPCMVELDTDARILRTVPTGITRFDRFWYWIRGLTAPVDSVRLGALLPLADRIASDVLPNGLLGSDGIAAERDLKASLVEIASETSGGDQGV